MAWDLEHVVVHVEDSEAKDKYDDSAGFPQLVDEVVEEATKVGSVVNEVDSGGDKGGPGGDEGSKMAESRGTTVAVVAENGLN